VQEAILRLNYSPNRAARSLANTAPRSQVLVIPEGKSAYSRRSSLAAIVQGITAAKARHERDYVLTLQLTAVPGPSEKTIHTSFTGGG
jgi:LacI family transcriptional regulator